MISKLLYGVIPVSVIMVLIGVRKLRERSWAFCKNDVKLDGKVVIVTGANCGIGYETTKELAKRDAEVILACRNVNLAIKAIERIEDQLRRKLKLRAMELDLANLRSVKQFAMNIKEQYKEVDILINNAGVYFPSNEVHQTKDNIEIHFGVNHLGPFYLTNLLLDIMKRSSRVVVVTSILHEGGKIDLDNIEKVDQSTGKLYANSKLANIYFAKELAKRTREKGIEVYALSPGFVKTSLGRHWMRWYHYIIMAPIAFFFMRSVKQGSQTLIYCATEPDLVKESTLLYRDCAPYRSKIEFDDETALKLWNKSESLIEKIMN